jgi:hypothetical protein
LLFGRTLRIHWFNSFNVCTHRCQMIVAHLSKNSTNKIPSLSQKTIAMNLHAEVCTLNLFSFFLPSTSVFLIPWKMHSEDAVLLTTTSWKPTGVKSSDAAAKSFTWPVYSVWRKGWKCVLIMKETLWRSNLTFWRMYPWDTRI